MKLSESTLGLINNKRCRALIALALDKSEQTIIRYISTNDDALTKASAIAVIKKETGLDESEIFEMESATA